MSRTLFVTEILVVVNCATCGVNFAVPDSYKKELRRTGQEFYCPRGDVIYYPGGESDAAKISRLASEAARERDNANFWREQEKERGRQLSAAKGQVTKIKNRVAKGVCPCCNRSFAQLERHMATQHPDFASPKGGTE